MIDDELNIGIDGTDIRAGMIGEIGVSPFFTDGEKIVYVPLHWLKIITLMPQ